MIAQSAHKDNHTTKRKPKSLQKNSKQNIITYEKNKNTMLTTTQDMHLERTLVTMFACGKTIITGLQ